ncbi:phage tail tip lysozyme [Rhizobium chutanense]|uniref:phage tail tip lysozyme n=1 Tax=Rhizobium chutanense TaxID=2035448 RepID=UPI0013DEF5B5|nr:phage tail tip lysozyme [Rhizobium chutanense]
MSLASFISGGDTGKTQGEITEQRKRLAQAMLEQGMETSPVQSPWQGAARLVQALMGGLALRRQEQQASGDDSAAPAGDPGYFPFAPLPDNGPVPPERPNLDPPMPTDDRGGQPMAPPAQPGGGLFAPLPDNGPIPTPRPAYPAPAASAPQPGDGNIFDGFMTTVKTKISNPYALASIASTGQAESGFSPKRANSSWSDPSQSGQQGTSGGIMSWRDTRLQKLYNFAAAKGEKPGAISPQTQAEFFLQEDPRLIARLNAATSVGEAQRLMNNAWRFAGYDQPGGEAARRTEQANSFLPQFLSEGFADPFASPANPPVPTPRPYRDPMVTTDDRREQPMAADQPGDESFAPLPDHGPIPSPRPGYRDPRVTTDERRQQPAAPAPGGGAAGSANDGAELQTILSDPVRRAELPPGMRNNNPANLKYAGQHRPGIIGPSENTDQGDRQVVYATPEAGMEHNFWQVMKKYREGMLTPNQIIAGTKGWTPNSFTAAANIARSMGIDPDDDLQLTDPAMAKKFMRALITQEQGTSGALYPDSMIEAAIAAQSKGVAHALPSQPANVPVPTPRPEYPDSQLTTDERRQLPATAPQLPGDDPFVPPGKVPVPTPKPGRHDRQAVRGTPSQQPVDADVFHGFMDTVKNGYKQRDGSIIQVTNPYGLAAIASTGQSESQFSAKRANSSWSDRSKSGKDGTSGGIMSWRNSRLQKLYNFAAQKGEKPGSISPQTQAEFFLQEDPRLIARLNAAKSLDEAQTLMNRAWQFAGYDEPGNKEVDNRLARARSFMPQYQTGGAADPFALPDSPSGPTPRPGPRDRKQTMNQGRGRASQAAGKSDALVRALLAQQQSGLW